MNIYVHEVYVNVLFTQIESKFNHNGSLKCWKFVDGLLAESRKLKKISRVELSPKIADYARSRSDPHTFSDQTVYRPYREKSPAREALILYPVTR